MTSFRRMLYTYHQAMKHHHTNIILSFCPKVCHKNFENRFTNKQLTSQNIVLNRDFCMGKLLAREVDHSRNISVKLLSKYLQSAINKCQFSIFPFKSLWQLYVAIATRVLIRLAQKQYYSFPLPLDAIYEIW